MLLTIDLGTGKPQALWLDPRRTPNGSIGEIDSAWIATHLRWVGDASGRERLTAP